LELTVGMAEYKIGNINNILITGGLGSCVAVCIRCEKTGNGFLFHGILPSYKNKNCQGNLLKFIDSGLYIALSDFYRYNHHMLTAKIFGGANLAGFRNKDIGYENTASIRKILKEEGIKIIEEDVGGNFGRNIEFNLRTGIVYVSTLNNGCYCL